MNLSIPVQIQSDQFNKSKLIDIKNVSLHFSNRNKNFQILDNINLQLYNNEFVCLLGPSGCGKSSLLNILAGFQKPTTGEVMINGKLHSKPNPNVGVVFQHHNLFPWLSIEKNIEFGLKMQSVPKSERKKLVSYYLRMVELESSAKMLPYQLSGGMKQRAAIARTLAANPKAILMDEPFSALDALTRETMQNNLLRIWRETRKCIFFITHDIDEALLLGNRILVMHPNPGRIVVDMSNQISKQNKSVSEIKHLKAFTDQRDFLISVIRERAINTNF